MTPNIMLLIRSSAPSLSLYSVWACPTRSSLTLEGKIVTGAVKRTIQGKSILDTARIEDDLKVYKLLWQ